MRDSAAKRPFLPHFFRTPSRPPVTIRYPLERPYAPRRVYFVTTLNEFLTCPMETPMNFKLGTIRSLCLPVLLLAFGTTFAFGKEDRPGKGIDRMVAKMEKELKLTPDQSTRIRAILEKDTAGMGMGKRHEGGPGMQGEGKNEGKGEGMGPLGGPEFAQQLRADKVDTETLNKAFEERQGRMRTMHAKRIATFVAIHDVLTPEQRAKAADEMEKRAAKMKK